MSDELDLSRELTGVVTGVDGVAELFPSGTLAQAVTLTLANAVSGEEMDDAKVAVTREKSGRLTVRATIGVEGGYAAQSVLRAVGDALLERLAAREPLADPPAIEVKASRIDTESAPS